MNTKEEWLSLAAKLLTTPDQQTGDAWSRLYAMRETVTGELAEKLGELTTPGRSAFLSRLRFALDKAELRLRYPFLLHKKVVTIINLNRNKASEYPKPLCEMAEVSSASLRKNRSVPVLFDADTGYAAYSVTGCSAQLSRQEIEALMRFYTMQGSGVSPDAVAEILLLPTKKYASLSVLYIPFFAALERRSVQTLIGVSDEVYLQVGEETDKIRTKKYMQYLKENSRAKIGLLYDIRYELPTLRETELQFLNGFQRVRISDLANTLKGFHGGIDHNNLLEECRHEAFLLNLQQEQQLQQTEELYAFFKRMQANYESQFRSEHVVLSGIDEFLKSTLSRLNEVQKAQKEEKAVCKRKTEDILKAAEAFCRIAAEKDDPEACLAMSVEQIAQIVEEIFLRLEKKLFRDAQTMCERLTGTLYRDDLSLLLQYAEKPAPQKQTGLRERFLHNTDYDETDEVQVRFRAFALDILGVSETEAGRLACRLRGSLTGAELYVKGVYLSCCEDPDKKAQKYLTDASERGEHRADSYLLRLSDDRNVENLAWMGNVPAALALADQPDGEKFLRIAVAYGDINSIARLADYLYNTVKLKFQSNWRYPNEAATKDHREILECLALHEYLLDRGQSSYNDIFSRLGLLYYLQKDYEKAKKYLCDNLKLSRPFDQKQTQYLLGRIYEDEKKTKAASSAYAGALGFKDAKERKERIQHAEREKAEQAARIKREEEEEIEWREVDSGGCFITTAICETLQKPDDCYELETMRAFRDSYLRTAANGNELVVEYYRIAPEIIRRIDSAGNGRIIYEALYHNYLIPSLKAIEDGQYEAARAIYIQMVLDLCSAYEVECGVIPAGFEARPLDMHKMIMY